MTTIAWDGRTLASDSRVTGGEGGLDSMRKLYRLPDGSVCGFAGNATNHPYVLEWLSAGAPRQRKPKLSGDFSGLVVLTNLQCYELDETLVPMRYGRKLRAIGTGADFAIGAMDQGADAAQAVRTAARYDEVTGGRVQTLRPRAVEGAKPLKLRA